MRQNLLWIAIVLLMAFGIGIPTWLYAHDTPGLRYENTPFPVLTDPVVAGGELVMVITRCNRFGYPLSYTFSRNLVPLDRDDLPVTIPPANTFAPPGCETVRSNLTTIPRSVEPGRYKLQAISLINGQWRTFGVRWETEPFTVRPND